MYKVKVSNIEGSSLSRVSSFIIADVPDKPNILPWKVQTDNQSLDIMV